MKKNWKGHHEFDGIKPVYIFGIRDMLLLGGIWAAVITTVVVLFLLQAFRWGVLV